MGASQVWMQKELPIIQPIQPVARAEPFDDPEWVFEWKYDGFRCMAYVFGSEGRGSQGKIQLRSKTTAILQGFPTLRSALQYELRVHDTIIDGEIVSFDDSNHVNFEMLLRRRGRMAYFAFDLLLLNGEDLRSLPLLERKKRLRRILPDASGTLIYADHVPERGTSLFALAEQNDLEGIIAKPAGSTYTPGTRWYKIRNQPYSQAVERPDVGDIRAVHKRA